MRDDVLMANQDSGVNSLQFTLFLTENTYNQFEYTVAHIKMSSLPNEKYR